MGELPGLFIRAHFLSPFSADTIKWNFVVSGPHFCIGSNLILQAWILEKEERKSELKTVDFNKWHLMFCGFNDAIVQQRIFRSNGHVLTRRIQTLVPCNTYLMCSIV